MRAPTLILTLLLALSLASAKAQLGTTRPLEFRRTDSIITIAKGFGPPSSQSFLSPNGAFQVIIEDAEPASSEEIKLVATMTKPGRPNPTVLWRKDFRSLPARCLQPEDLVISNDGEFFLLAAMEERWILFRKDLPPVTLGNQRYTRRFSPHATHLQSLPYDLTIIDQLSNKPVVGVWHADWDDWDAFDVRSNERFEPGTNTVAKWNSMTREDILKKLSRLNHDKLRRQIGQFSPKLSDLATNVTPAVRFGEIRDIYYQFLALLHNPTDRALFEEMVKPQSNDIPPPGWPNIPFPGFTRTLPLPRGVLTPLGQQRETLFVAIDFWRSKGDALLAVFDQKASATNITGMVFLQRPQFYLGSAAGRIKLPLDVSVDSGPLRVWLTLRDKTTNNLRAVGSELMETDFKHLGGANYPPQGKEIPFLFQTVTPGEYYLKAIWDKRPAFNDHEKAGPGDYESPWIGPITITAGDTTTNIIAACTNRATAGGETYYAADELRLRLSHR